VTKIDKFEKHKVGVAFEIIDRLSSEGDNPLAPPVG
jgi:hypothetical protein